MSEIQDYKVDQLVNGMRDIQHDVSEIKQTVNDIQTKAQLQAKDIESVRQVAEGNKSTISRLGWTVILALIGAVMTFILGGGLNLIT